MPNFSFGLRGFIVVTQRVTRVGAARNAPGGPSQGLRPNRPLCSKGGTWGQANPLKQRQGWPPRDPPSSHRHLPRAIVPVPMALKQYLQRFREFGHGHRSASGTCDPSVPPLPSCTPLLSGPPPQTVPLLLISQQRLLSRAEPGFVPPHLLSPTEPSSCGPWKGQDLSCCHHPPEPPRDPNCSGQGDKIWVRGGRFGSGTIEPAQKPPNFLPSCNLLRSKRRC